MVLSIRYPTADPLSNFLIMMEGLSQSKYKAYLPLPLLSDLNMIFFSWNDKVSSSKCLRHISMAASASGLKLDFSLNRFLSNFRCSIRKCHINLSFIPYTFISSSILALFICSGVGTNLSPFERRKKSFLERWRLDKLIMISATKFLSYLLFSMVAL